MKFIYENVLRPFFYVIVVIMLFVLFGLQGCATTLDELYEEAKETGDWTKVDKREDSIIRREAKPKGCCIRNGRVLLFCECVSPNVFFKNRRSF